jgi:hypothetical protein
MKLISKKKREMKTQVTNCICYLWSS